jgi:hypothetical protein
MYDYILNEFCKYLYDFYNPELLDGYMLIPSSEGNVLVLVCEQNNYESTKAFALDLFSRNSNQISNVQIYHVGEVDFIAHFSLDRGTFNACNLAWIWQEYRDLLRDDSSLGEYIRTHTARLLTLKLQELDRGQGRAFEDLLAKIISFSFLSALAMLEPAVRSYTGEKIRDFKLSLYPGCALQSHIQRAGLPSNNLLVEAKNQIKDTPDDVTQIRGYLGSTKFASVGLLVTRSPLETPAANAVVDANRMGEQGSRILIIALNDWHVQQFITNSGCGNFMSNEHLLIHQFEQTINAVY